MEFKRFLYLLAVINNLITPARFWNYTYLYSFLGSFIYRVRTQEIVWFISERLDKEQSEHTDNFIRRLATFENISHFVWTNRLDVRMKKIQSKRGFNSVVITTGVEDPVMVMHSRLLTGRHFSLSLVIYTTKVSDFKAVEDLCSLLHRENFVNSVVYFQTHQGDDNLFGYGKYPQFHMINKTNYAATLHDDLTKVIYNSLDVVGYTFYTSFRRDVPQVFPYDDRLGKRQVQGTTYRMLEAFIDSLNGRLEEYDITQAGTIINMEEVLNLVRFKRIELSPHAYALFKTDDVLDKSYPILVVKWCLMVPLRNSVSTFLYTLQPFEWLVWILVAMVLLTLCLLDLISCNVGIIRLTFNDIWLNNFSHLLNISPGHQLDRPALGRFLHYVCVFWFGFFLSSNYTSFLGSSLTVSIFREQINTIEDVIRAKLPVMIVDYELNFLLSEGYVMPQDFYKLLRVVNSSTFYKHQMALNESFAYFVTDDRWHFLNEAQKHLKHKLFKFSDICFGSYHLAYPMQTDSPIWRNLEYFLFHIHSSGLFQMYESKALYYARAAGHMPMIVETNEATLVGLEHLQIVFITLGVMHLMAVGSLMVERVLYRN